MSGWLRDVVRVVSVPADRELDGEDWILASFGSDPDGRRYYLTTDHLTASDVTDLDLTPQHLAELLAAAVNREHRP